MEPIGTRLPLIKPHFTNSHYPATSRTDPTHVVKENTRSMFSSNDSIKGDQSKLSKNSLKMYLTIDTQNVSLLRHLVMNAFNGVVSFMRIEPIDHAKKMKVCLCLLKPVEDQLMSSIMKTLPSAEFGRFSSAL